jgi:hypothetical protein
MLVGNFKSGMELKEKRVMKKNYVAFVLSIIAFSVVGKENESWFPGKPALPHIGNFALPISQQTGPLLAFGQNIVDKGELLAFAYGNQHKGHQESFAEVIPSIIYGITDKCSLFVEVPVAVKFRSEEFTSRGLADLIVQLEGIVYINEVALVVNEITLVGNMTFPTGSAKKDPAIGFGSPTFFVGVTASHTGVDWYYFTSLGEQITTIHKGTKFGNQFLYQFGLSRNIVYKTDKWLFNWEIELNGVYRQRNKVSGMLDCNSGGNTLFLGPSLWFATQRFIVSGGISAVITEHLFGNQHKTNYLAAAFVGWKF